jgi:FkbM family methyltransferase
MFWGGYEGAETRMIRSILRASPTVVELGSSLGITTAHIAAVMAHGGRLVCVEANPRLIPGLSERVALLSGQQRVDVIHAAITGHCGTTELIIAGETVGSRIGSPRPDEPIVQVPAMTLREILRRANIAEFDLVSDIEGAERLSCWKTRSRSATAGALLSTFTTQSPTAARCQRSISSMRRSQQACR